MAYRENLRWRGRHRQRSRAGRPFACQTVGVWSKGDDWLVPSDVVIKNRQVRTAADGSFQRPDNLLVCLPYRVVVLAPGMEPILSEWIPTEEKPRVLLPMIQRPLDSRCSVGGGHASPLTGRREPGPSQLIMAPRCGAKSVPLKKRHRKGCHSCALTWTSRERGAAATGPRYQAGEVKRIR
jgi:hypothetical protein